MPSSTVDIKAPASNGIPDVMVEKTGRCKGNVRLEKHVYPLMYHYI